MSHRIPFHLSGIEYTKQESKYVRKAELPRDIVALAELLIGIILFAIGFDFFFFNKPSHPIFDVGGIMLFVSLFMIIHTMLTNIK